MCRFAFYLGHPISLSALLSEPVNSIINQSFHAHEREEPLNGDGFGIAWYSEGHQEPALFRSITPAWNNDNLMDLARVTRSKCVLAHVRAASPGSSVSEANCHPFRRHGMAFMHNGDIGGFSEIRRRLLMELSEQSFRSVRGSTDSEHLFALLVDESHRVEDPTFHGRLGSAITKAIRRVRDLVNEVAPGHHLYINAVLTNGAEAMACRYTTDSPENAESLYYHHGRRYVCEGGVCRMLDPGDQGKALIISSEPLSEDPGWEPVAVNHVVLVNADFSAEVRPIEI